MYDTTGMFYIHGTAEPANAHDLVSVLVEQVSVCGVGGGRGPGSLACAQHCLFTHLFFLPPPS